MALCFGKTPARPNAVTLKFASVFNAANLPTPPASFGHESSTIVWGMLANDQWGDCVLADAAHEHMLWTHEGGLPTAQFTSAGVLSDYSAITGFNPNDPSTDQGTDMQAAAAYRQNTGVIDAAGVRHKIDAYSALKVGDLDELALATWLFGAVSIGVNCPESMQDQFTSNQVWDVVKSDKLVGGHCIPCVGRNTAGNFVFVTWGRLQAATPTWVQAYNDEGICYLDLEVINASSKITPEGFNQDALSGYLKELT